MGGNPELGVYAEWWDRTPCLRHQGIHARLLGLTDLAIHGMALDTSGENETPRTKMKRFFIVDKSCLAFGSRLIVLRASSTWLGYKCLKKHLAKKSIPSRISNLSQTERVWGPRNAHSYESFLKKVLEKDSALLSAQVSRINALEACYGETQHYQPDVEGLLRSNSAKILSSNQGLIKGIGIALKLEPDEIDELVFPVHEAFDRYVHLFGISKSPSSRSRRSFQTLAGGRALGAPVHGREYPALPHEESYQKKQALRIRWQVALSLAGLFHDAGKPVSDLKVTNLTG